YVVPKPERAYPAGSSQMVSTTLGWRLINPKMPEEWTVSLGEATEQLVDKYQVSRERQDEYAVLSRSEEHTSELQSRFDLVCRLLLEKKKRIQANRRAT